MQAKSVAEQLFFTTVRIDTKYPDGGTGAGTGFVYNHTSGNRSFPLIVTNKHVVQGAESGTFAFFRRHGEQPVLGMGYNVTVESWTDAWFGHPSADVDIAICPLAPLEAHLRATANLELFYRAASTDMMPTPEQLERLDAIENITFIGYPNGMWDARNLLPIARRGTTATPIAVDFNGQPTFLVDASVFGGSSGSPAFVLNQGMSVDKVGHAYSGTRLLFVGVVAAVYFRTETNNVVSAPIPVRHGDVVTSREMLDLGVVFKARTVWETAEALLRARGEA